MARVKLAVHGARLPARGRLRSAVRSGHHQRPARLRRPNAMRVSFFYTRISSLEFPVSDSDDRERSQEPPTARIIRSSSRDGTLEPRTPVYETLSKCNAELCRKSVRSLGAGSPNGSSARWAADSTRRTDCATNSRPGTVSKCSIARSIGASPTPPPAASVWCGTVFRSGVSRDFDDTPGRPLVRQSCRCRPWRRPASRFGFLKLEKRTETAGVWGKSARNLDSFLHTSQRLSLSLQDDILRVSPRAFPSLETSSL